MNVERLIVFTRYPEPGKTKTRLIPALGAEGATQLQRQMTNHTIAQVRELAGQCPLSVEVRYAGGDRSSMQTWLGADLDHQPQGEGDLGARMANAFQTAFAQGIERAVTIGTDCPDLNASLLTQAFEALRHHDLVLGPATDGGYYLIGLRRLVPELFVGVDWGTETVFRQTVEKAEALGLAIAYLAPLTDVDRPEDLGIWERVKGDRAPTNSKISVIIPVLNEADRLKDRLVSLPSLPDVEVIVVDGGSQDGTVHVARACGACVISGPPGRASQMNAGANLATGEILLFLHADTQLPDSFTDDIRQVLAQPRVVAGAFNLQIDGDLWGLRLIERGVNWRSHHFQLPYGDQAIFLRANAFRQVGGFPALPIMEDFELVRRLKGLGQVAIAPSSVITSARRWKRLGILRTTLINQLVIVGYLVGVSGDRLVRWYRGRRD
jgi:hypothetical protein